MIWFPRNVGALAALTDNADGKLALSNIHVRHDGENWYRAEASNGKVLAIVCGPSMPPKNVETEAAVEIGAGLLVPAADWRNGFKLGGKKEAVALTVADDEVTFASGRASTTVRRGEGRFPDVSLVLPRTPPLLRFTVNPAQLAALLGVAAAIAGPESNQVELFFYGEGKPVGLCSRNAEGQTFDALLVPLT